MVYRIYVEKKAGFDVEAKTLLSDVRELLGFKSVENIRILNRYDAEEIEEELFQRCLPCSPPSARRRLPPGPRPSGWSWQKTPGPPCRTGSAFGRRSARRT